MAPPQPETLYATTTPAPDIGLYFQGHYTLCQVVLGEIVVDTRGADAIVQLNSDLPFFGCHHRSAVTLTLAIPSRRNAEIKRISATEAA
jgi:hypothetical protein